MIPIIPSLMIPTYPNYSTFASYIYQANPSLSLGLFLDMFKGFHGNSRCPRIWSPVNCPGNCTGLLYPLSYRYLHQLSYYQSAIISMKSSCFLGIRRHFPGFPMVFPWFSHGFPMVFLWFSHGFPYGFPYGFPMGPHLEEFERLLEDSVEMETQHLAPSSPELATGATAQVVRRRMGGGVEDASGDLRF